MKTVRQTDGQTDRACPFLRALIIHMTVCLLIMSLALLFQSPTQLSSTNGVKHDAGRAVEEQNNLLPKPQEQDSLQADSEKGLVKLSSV